MDTAVKTRTLSDQVLSVLAQYAFSLNDEKKLQAEISEILEANNIPHRREVALNKKDIIDFLFEDGTGLEIKIKGQRFSIYRQLRRYAESNEVSEIILATAISMGLPSSIEGKPARVFSLSRAHL